jgi:CBS domain containing-hemolysin-like protein
MIFSLTSQFLLKDIGSVFGILIILFFIILGIIFDIIGVAVQSSDETPFHAMASKKIKRARHAKKMLKNASKVSTFCNDVIGDICNIISGSAGIIVATNVAIKFNFDIALTNLIVTSIIASLTIGGKALGKGIAIKNGEEIISIVTKIINKFHK